MAQWIETPEPYIKVQEQVHTAALNPVAGEDLIIGCVLIADAGPEKTLITSQGEFLKTFSSQDITQEYLQSLNNLYTGDDTTLASTMWSNAYRLAGSNTMLVVRASKAKDLYFVKPLQKEDTFNNTYILRDGDLLKYIRNGFKFVLDIDGDNSNHDQDGWSINISGIGIFGNRTTDQGPQYDYYVDNLVDLVDLLNETNKFFSPAYTFYKNAAGTDPYDANTDDKKAVVSVVFEEVYLGTYIIDTSDPRCSDGHQYVLFCSKNGDINNSGDLINLNDENYSGFVPAKWYAVNQYNSATTLKVRIRRFNHDAVVTKELSDSEVASLTEEGKSPYTVLTSVLDTFTKKGTEEPPKSITDRDFYEVAVWDPSVSSEVAFFNLGNITGRGDIDASELNSLIQMIQVNLPDDLHDLGLNYFGYGDDDTYTVYEWIEKDLPAEQHPDFELDSLPEASDDYIGKYAEVGSKTYYCEKQIIVHGSTQAFANLTIDPTEYKILSVSDTDLKKALDEIVLDEVYTVEGLCDLGNTELSFQNYMANVAVNSNYFYPVSTVNSTNYMAVGNAATKIAQNSYKLYMSAPWDIDTGTLGWKYYASPAVLYWEAVARNRRNNEEFASILGQTYGVVQYQRPVAEFNKKSRQMLLSKRINTVLWDVPTQAWTMNDSFTKQSVNNIMSEDGNSRLAIRIGKAMPIILRQFIGRKCNEKLCEDMYSTIEYYFKTVILPMGVSVDGYQIFVPYIEANARKNTQQVTINIRFFRSLKMITVFEDLFDVGMDISVDAHNLTGEG